MAETIRLRNYRPIGRDDDVKWTQATIQETLTPAIEASWADVETFAVDDYPDSLHPPEFSFTTDNGTLSPRLGTFRIRWNDPGVGYSYSDPLGPSGYPDTEELVAESSVEELVEAAEDDQDTWRVEAISAIEDTCGQAFTVYEGSYVLDGRGGDTLYLPRRLESLASFSVRGVLWDLAAIRVHDDLDRIELVSTYAPNYATQAIRDISGYRDRAFNEGQSSIVITGTWGWSTCPQSIRSALRLDMEDAALAEASGLASSIRAYRKMGMKSISQGNLRADVGSDPTLSPRVMRLLAPFAWSGIGRTA